MKHINIHLMRDGTVREKVVEDVEILGENEKYIVFNDSYFTKIEKVTSKHCRYNYLNKVHINDHTNDTFWQKYYGDFSITVYTDIESLKVIENRINKEFNKFIKEKVGRYMMASDIKIKLEV
jgi:hypothetical protein